MSAKGSSLGTFLVLGGLVGGGLLLLRPAAQTLRDRIASLPDDEIRAAVSSGSTRVATTPTSPKAGTGSPGVTTVNTPAQDAAYEAAPRASGGGAGTITQAIRDAFGLANPGYDAQLAAFKAIEDQQNAAIAARG